MWSQIQNNPIARYTNFSMNLGRLPYHNTQHLREMYSYLESYPYDEALDWAAQLHDYIYDEKPLKEYRSAKYAESILQRHLSREKIEQVVEYILQTIDHSKDTLIVRADLYGFITNPIRNCELLKYESKMIYGTNDKQFAINTIKFVSGLYDRLPHGAYFDNVAEGIERTIDYLEREYK